MPPTRRLFTILMFALSLIALGVYLSTPAVAEPAHYEAPFVEQSVLAVSKGPATSVKVPITLGVMSRCPDARFCEDVFDSVLEEVGFEKVDVDLSFIARFNESEPKYGVSCMHGQQECDGNVQELCVSKHLHLAEWWTWLQCINLGGLVNVGNVGRAKECAEMSGFEWDGSDGIAECWEGKEGVNLFRESIKHSLALGIK
ncbi:hypothetical protein FRB95_012633 [Tulasnella sp. JGI-2019a]|nr:hypothetical protein FRB95_012633 [Tulasnella sp. JGI-2019a]